LVLTAIRTLLVGVRQQLKPNTNNRKNKHQMRTYKLIMFKDDMGSIKGMTGQTRNKIMKNTTDQQQTDAGNARRNVKRIARHETTQRSAEIYQNRLYSKYDYVRLVDFPRFSSTRTFIWEVA